MPGRQNLAH